jgi:hypothetical protein
VQIFKNNELLYVSGLLDKREIFLAIFYEVSALGPLNKIHLPNMEISFDIVTIYQILTNRGSCANVIKNYAKKNDARDV